MPYVITLEEKDICEIACFDPSQRSGKYIGGTRFSCASQLNAFVLKKLLVSLGYEQTSTKFVMEDSCFHSTYPYSRILETVCSDDSDEECGER